MPLACPGSRTCTVADGGPPAGPLPALSGLPSTCQPCWMPTPASACWSSRWTSSGDLEALCGLDSVDWAQDFWGAPSPKLPLPVPSPPHSTAGWSVNSGPTPSMSARAGWWPTCHLCQPPGHVSARHPCTHYLRHLSTPMASKDEPGVVSHARQPRKGAFHTCTPLLPSQEALHMLPVPQGSWLALQEALTGKPGLSGCRNSCYLLSTLSAHRCNHTVAPTWGELGFCHPRPHMFPALTHP